MRLGKTPRLLGRDGQNGNALRFIVHAAAMGRLAGDELFLPQILQRPLQGLRLKLCAQRGFLRGTAERLQRLEYGLRRRIAPAVVPCGVLRKGIAVTRLKPDACR